MTLVDSKDCISSKMRLTDFPKRRMFCDVTNRKAWNLDPRGSCSLVHKIKDRSKLEEKNPTIFDNHQLQSNRCISTSANNVATIPGTMMHQKSVIFVFVSRIVLAWAARSIEASFVVPASPTVTRSTPQSIPTTPKTLESLSFARSQVISSGYGIYSPSALQAKKKKAANGPAAAKKVQVKMLKHVAGTGSAGDVIQVTPAFFNNKLRPTKSAMIISDDEVASEQAEAQEKEAETKAKANELQELLNETTLSLLRKAGPDGQLFGGIGPKCIMSELESVVQDDFLSKKSVRVAEVLDENGKKIRGDIKHTGDFGARINLLSGVSAKIGISVQEE